MAPMVTAGVGIYDALADLSTGKFVLIENGVPGYVSQLVYQSYGQ